MISRRLSEAEHEISLADEYGYQVVNDDLDEAVAEVKKIICEEHDKKIINKEENHMMLYPAIDDIKQKADSKYTLAILTAKRARDIIDGKPVLIEGADTENPASEAANEIAEDLITYKREEE